MSNLDAAFILNFKRETWILYGVGLLTAIMRSVARVRRLGFRNLQADDFLMLVGVTWFTILCIALNKVISGGGSNLMTEEDIQELTPEIKERRVSGSKWVFVSEHSMVLTIWTLKTCMLILYSRITHGLKQRRLVNYVSIYVALGFVGSELALFLICRPLSNYWAVPTPNSQCSSYQHYEIIQGVFAISADILMLIIAIPLLITVRLPLKQKAILLFIFGLGIFVIVAALLTKVYCLVPSLISYVYMSWYFREATVAMLVTCLPMTWSLLRDIFPALKSWTGGSRPTYLTPGASGQRRTGSRRTFSTDQLKLQPFKQLKSGSQIYTTNTTVSNTQGSSSPECPDGSELEHSMGIRQDVTITIHSDGEGDIERADSPYRAAGVDWPSPPSRIISR